MFVYTRYRGAHACNSGRETPNWQWCGGWYFIFSCFAAITWRLLFLLFPPLLFYFALARTARGGLCLCLRAGDCNKFCSTFERTIIDCSARSLLFSSDCSSNQSLLFFISLGVVFDWSLSKLLRLSQSFISVWIWEFCILLAPSWWMELISFFQWMWSSNGFFLIKCVLFTHRFDESP